MSDHENRQDYEQPDRSAVPGRAGCGARRGFWLVVLAALTVVAATACIRLDVAIVVHDADEASFTGRMTASPRLLEMMGGVESLEALKEDFYADMEEDIVGSIVAGSDPDGWRGFAFEWRGSLDAVTRSVRPDSVAFDDPNIEQTANGWRFSWQTGRSGYEVMAELVGVPTEQVEAMADFLTLEGFRYTMSVSLPGRLESSNSQSTKTRDGMTTALWEIDDPESLIGFLLVTDTTPEASSDGLGTGAGSGGLGTGAMAGIVGGGSIVVGLVGLWWWIRRTNRRDERDDPDSESKPSAPDASGI